MKRIYCFLICFAIAFSGFGTLAADSGAAADNAEAVTASEKIEPLTQLGVLDVTEPNSTVLKKNIVYSLDKITGGSTEKMYFGNTDLSTPLMYGQALMTLVDFLGYTPYIDMYYSGNSSAESYRAAAGRIGLISKGSAHSLDTAITVNEYAELLYKAICDIPLMRASSFTDNNVYYSEDDSRTVLSEYLNIKKIKGVVKGVDDISFVANDTKTESSVKIGAVWYSCNISGSRYSYLGMRVDAYVDADEDVLYFMVVKDNYNRVLRLKSSEISVSGTKPDSITYQPDKTDKVYTQKISDEVDVIYNRELITNPTTDDFRRGSSDYILIDNDCDGKTDAVIIEQFKTITVYAISKGDQRILDMYGNVFDFKQYFDEGYKLYNEKGAETTLNLIARYNVIAYLETASGEIKYAVVSKKKVNGVIKSEKNNMKDIMIDGEWYECSEQYLQNRDKLQQIKLGDRVTAFMDHRGYVCDIRYTETTERAAYLMGAQNEGMGVVKFKILDQDSEIKKVELTSRVKLNGVSISADALLNEPVLKENGALKKQLIMYRENTDGKIAQIKTAEEKSEIGGRGYNDFTLNYDTDKGGHVRTLKLNNQKIIGSKYVVTTSSILFNVSNNDEDCYAQEGTAVPINCTLDIKLYNVNENYEPQYMVMQTRRTVGGWVDFWGNIFMVKDIYQGLNDDGEVVYYIDYYYDVNGKLQTLIINDENIKTEDYNIISGDSRLYDVAFKDIPRGSLVFLTSDYRGAYAVSLQHMPMEDNSEYIFEKKTSVTGNEYGVDERTFNGQYLFSYGKVLSRVEAGIVVNNHGTLTADEIAAGKTYPMSEWNRVIPLVPSDRVLLYDKAKDEIYLETADCIMPGDMVFTKRSGVTYNGIFVYRNK